MDTILHELIVAAEAQMKAKLAEARATFAHSGSKGEQVEAAFRSFLRRYLPLRLSVGHGEAIDIYSRRTNQTDVVIASEDHPFSFSPDEPGLFFIDGVCAGGEVKSNLTSDELKRTVDSSRNWKKLRINPGKDTTIRTNPADQERFYACPPYFLFAMDSALSLQTLHERMSSFGSFDPSRADNVLDGVFVLDKGWIIDFGVGTGTFQYISHASKQAMAGWQRKTSANVLFYLLAWLHGCMPKFVRWEPILMRYLIPQDGTAVQPAAGGGPRSV